MSSENDLDYLTVKSTTSSALAAAATGSPPTWRN